MTTLQINTRNNQEVYNYVWQKFVIEEAPKCASNDECVYAPFEEGQIGCAIGCLLSSEDQILWAKHSEFNDPSICSIELSNSDMFEKYFDHSQIDFLSDLQDMHDSSVSIGEREKKMRLIAEKHSLSVPRVKR